MCSSFHYSPEYFTFEAHLVQHYSLNLFIYFHIVNELSYTFFTVTLVLFLINVIHKIYIGVVYWL